MIHGSKSHVANAKITNNFRSVPSYSHITRFTLRGKTTNRSKASFFWVQLSYTTVFRILTYNTFFLTQAYARNQGASPMSAWQQTSPGERNASVIARQRLQRANLDEVLLRRLAVPGTRDGAIGPSLCGGAVVMSDANEVLALSTGQLGLPPQQPPRMPRLEVGPATELLDLREPALVHGNEGNDALLGGFPVLGTDVGGVPIGRAQIQRVPTRSAAASKQHKSDKFTSPTCDRD